MYDGPSNCDEENAHREVLNAINECEKYVAMGIPWLINYAKVKFRGNHVLTALYNKISNKIDNLLECYGKVPQGLYSKAINMCTLAEALILYTMEKSGIKNTPRQLNDEERRILEQFEKFRILGCYGQNEETCIRRLINYIIADRENICKVISEFLERIFTEFKFILERDLSQELAREIEGTPQLVYAVADIYRGYFDLVSKAITRLLREHPLWIRRLFADYTYVILDSLETRQKIVGEINRVKSEGRDITKRLLELSDKKTMVFERYREDYARIYEEIERLRSENEELKSKIRELMGKIESYEEELKAKESVLKELGEKYSREKEVLAAIRSELGNLENTIMRLRSEKDRYKRLYEDAKTRIMELESIKMEVENALKGIGKKRLISLGAAKSWELRFIAKIMAKTNPPLKLYDPFKDEEIEIKKWSEELESYMDREAKGPKGWRAKFIYKVWRAFPPSRVPRIVVEALTFVRTKRYKEKGYDLEPATLHEVSDIVWRALEEARSSGHIHILIIASPTGFTNEAIEFISGEPGKAFISDRLVVALYDPVENKIYLNKHDPLTMRFLREILEPYTEPEKVAKIARALEEIKGIECPIPICSKIISFSYAMEKLKATFSERNISVDEASVEQAFNYLRDRNLAKVLYLGEPILCLTKDVGVHEIRVKETYETRDNTVKDVIRTVGSMTSFSTMLAGVKPPYTTVFTLVSSFLALNLERVKKVLKSPTLDDIINERLTTLYTLCLERSKVKTSKVAEIYDERISVEAEHVKTLIVAKEILKLFKIKYPDIAGKLEEFLTNPDNISNMVRVLKEIEKKRKISVEELTRRIHRVLKEAIEAL